MVESISKTGSPGWVRAGAMPASRASEVDGVSVEENFSYMYECLDQFNNWGGGGDVTNLSPFW